MDIAAIAQLATKAGAEGVSDLSAGCGRKDQSKKVQKGLGAKKFDDRLTYVRAPATVGGKRALVDIALHLPSTWAQSLPGFHEAPLSQHWQRKVECGELLPRTIPLAVYSDGVAGSTQNDPGFYMMTMTDLRTGKKAPIAAAQKKWCYGTYNTLNAIWTAVVQNLNECLLLERPVQLVEVRGDLQEYVIFHGHPHYGRTNRVCMFCDCDDSNRFDEEMKWTTTDTKGYLKETGAKVVRVKVATSGELSQMRGRLNFDNAEKTYVTTVDSEGVKAGMRLISVEGPPIVGDFPTERELPATLSFFPKQKQGKERAFSRPPPAASYKRFSLSLFQIDWMHTVDLGIARNFCGFALWPILENDHVGNLSGSRAEKRAVRLATLNENLKTYYNQLPPSTTKIGEISLRTIGTKPWSSVLKLKASETRHLVPYVVEQLSGTPGIDNRLRRAGSCLKSLYDVFQWAPQSIDPDMQRKACVLYAEHVFLFRSVGSRLVPKHHFLFLCLATLTKNGNPFSNWVYGDESYNGIAKKIACSQKCPRLFSATVLKKLLALADP